MKATWVVEYGSQHDYMSTLVIFSFSFLFVFDFVLLLDPNLYSFSFFFLMQSQYSFFNMGSTIYFCLSANKITFIKNRKMGIRNALKFT